MSMHCGAMMYCKSMKAQPLTQGERDATLQQWQTVARFIMSHDGNPTEDMPTVVNVKGNPLLSKAIEQIRDEYFESLSAMEELIRERESQPRWRKLLSNKELIAQQDEALQISQIVLTDTAFHRLQVQNYGFSRDEKAEILEKAHVKNTAKIGRGLSDVDALLLVRKVIGRSLDCFENAYNHAKPIGDRKPRRFSIPPSFDPDYNPGWDFKTK